MKVFKMNLSSDLCKWTLIDDDNLTYETSCDNAFSITSGTLKDNEMVYCCFCGKKIKE
jgi:hypothetical protein